MLEAPPRTTPPRNAPPRDVSPRKASMHKVSPRKVPSWTDPPGDAPSTPPASASLSARTPARRRTPRSALAAVAGCLALAAGPAAPAAGQAVPDRPAELTFERIFEGVQAGSVPDDLLWSPDGRRLVYRFDDGEGTGLWVFEPGRGEPRLLVRDPEPEDGAGEASEADAEVPEAADEGPGKVGEYAWSPDGEALAVVAGGDLWLVPANEGPPVRLTETEDDEEAPAFSPDGGRLAFIRDFDLWLLDLETRSERALTADGVENEVLNGTTDWVYWEEIWGRDATGYWWSPDGSRIAYYRFEEEPVGSYPLVDFTAVPYPEVTWQKYPKAGTDNPRVRVGVLEVAAADPQAATVWLDTGGDGGEYLARVDWRPDGRRVAVQKLDRDQTRLDLLSCDPGAGVCDLLLRETWPTWVNLGDDFRWLPDGRFLWGSERTGWRHLYLYSADATLVRPLTAGEWSVTSLDGVDAERGRAVFTAYAPGPLGARDRRVAAVALDGEGAGAGDGGAGGDAGDRGAADGAAGGGTDARARGETAANGMVVPLTEGDGWHAATVAPSGGRWVHGWSDSETPPRLAVREADGREVAALPAVAPAFDPAALPHWRYFTIDGPDGAALPARELAAGGRPAGERGPALMYHYGGPGSQVVADRWGGERDLWHKLMAQRGFTVLSVDNVASAFFGKRGEDRQHRRFGPLNLAAQRAGAAWLAATGRADPARIGLWGWSGGGTNTLYCLFHSPGTWAAGTAGAPVTDWRLYDTIWTERYLDHPEANPEGYAASSPITHAAALADRLLLVHGTADDNVHPQNTMALAHAWVEAGIPFEIAVYPGQTHGIREAAARHFYERMTEFFERTLAP